MSIRSPLISVIMNCYNSDSYLREAIDSVLGQSYENWELIFWDNNSTDKSSDILCSYNDKRIKYYKAAETSPLYNARNLALAQCSGDYVGFLDCDDIWLSHKLEDQVALVDRGFEFVYGAYATVDANGKKISDNLKDLISGEITNSLFRLNPISIGTVLIKKSLLENYRFDSFYNLLGDLDMWVSLSLVCQIETVNNVVEYSRQHDSNTSNTLEDQWKTERRYFYRKFLTLSNSINYPWLILYILKTELLGLIGRR